MRRSLIYCITIVAILIFAFFLYGIIKGIQKFHDLDKANSVVYKNNEFLIATNIHTSNKDTLFLNGTYLINFWASWCNPCLKEQPTLEQFANEHRNIRVIQLSFDSISAQRSIIQKFKWTLPAYALKDTFYFPVPKALPTTLLVYNGKVVENFVGVREWNDSNLFNHISVILAKENVVTKIQSKHHHNY